MASRSEPARSERPGADGLDKSTHTYGLIFQGSAYALLGAAVLLAVVVLWEALSGSPTLEWIPFLFFLVVIATNAYQSAGQLLSTFRLTEDRLHQERPMHADVEVRLEGVRRMFVGGLTVEIYAASESDPVLTFYRKLQGGDNLLEKLAQALPEEVEVEHPSGELAGRLGGRCSEASPA